MDSTTIDAPAPTDGAPAPVDARPSGADVVTPADLGTCPAGQTLCGATCVDLQTDATRCGTCSRNCRVLPGVDASAITCERGVCTVGTHCTAGLADCDHETGNGCETDLTQNAACGACGVACTGETPLCAMVIGDSGTPTRRCTNGCTPMTPTRCGAACVDLQTDSTNCGGCGRSCVLANAVPGCRAGACTVGTCIPPFANCDGNDANGCETNLTTTGACGACGTSCGSRPNTVTQCEMAVCRYACTAGFGDCDGTPSNGCETALATTATHCGMCGRVCSLPNATAACNLGACTVATCNVGFGDCNLNPADGCEVDVRDSVAHCGGCGRSCSTPNATATCSAGLCRVGECNTGYGDCDANPATGCEVPLTTTSNCGACGRACPAPAGAHTVATCVRSGMSAMCGAVCESGWLDCDGNIENGCEAMGACTRTREVFSDNFMSGVGNWTLPNNGQAAFGISYSENCRNPTFCFGCYVCMSVHGYCGTGATATLSRTFDFTRVLSGLFSYYSQGSPGATDRFILQASTDGGSSWRSLVTPAPSACCLNTASPQRVDLTTLAGAPSVRFRFLFENNCDPGDAFGISWTIDDVTLSVVERTY